MTLRAPGTASGTRICPVMSDTRAVMPPFPVSGWWTKKYLSLTAVPSGPTKGAGQGPSPFPVTQVLRAPPAISSPSDTVTSTEAAMASPQPHTARNLAHSARSNRGIRSARPAGRIGTALMNSCRRL
ncbi:hypothetical protein ACFQYP_53535 [Nonomuraea antimicrobica]